MKDAACSTTPPSVFFPEHGDSIEPALALCAVCPVREECRELGANESAGIWGGEYRGRPTKCRKCGDRMVGIHSGYQVCNVCSDKPAASPKEREFKQPVPGECYRCGEHFEPLPGKPNAKLYCSRRCQKRVSTNYPVLICPECGEEFEQKRRNQVCCTKLCGKRHRREVATG